MENRGSRMENRESRMENRRWRIELPFYLLSSILYLLSSIRLTSDSSPLTSMKYDSLTHDLSISYHPCSPNGAVAQLAERVARIHEARGSNPLSSIYPYWP